MASNAQLAKFKEALDAAARVGPDFQWRQFADVLVTNKDRAAFLTWARHTLEREEMLMDVHRSMRRLIPEGVGFEMPDSVTCPECGRQCDGPVGYTSHWAQIHRTEPMPPALPGGMTFKSLQAEIARLQAALEDAAIYAQVCPVPAQLATDARAEMSERRQRILIAARGDPEQSAGNGNA